jgi:transcription termination factor NusB
MHNNHLSFSKIKPLLDGVSPQARETAIKYAVEKFQDTEATLLGSLVHSLVLGESDRDDQPQPVTIEGVTLFKTFSAVDFGFDSFRTKSAQEVKAQALAAGLVQVKPAFRELAEQIAHTIGEHWDGIQLKRPPEHCEQKLEGEYLGVNWLGYADILADNFVLDLKTVGEFEKAMKPWNIDIYAAQLMIYEALSGRPLQKFVTLSDTAETGYVVTLNLTNYIAENREKLEANITNAVAVWQSLDKTPEGLSDIRALIRGMENQHALKLHALAGQVWNYEDVLLRF